MVRLREIPRTAAFAWSPGSDSPYIATGTRAGAVDADFSNETKLELWDLALGDPQQGPELQPAAEISTDSRFHDLAWGEASDDHERGIIAGALENGSLDLWDAENLIKNESGAIKSLQFNPFRPELLATAGAKGELYISNLNDVANPFRLGTSAARADDFESVDWNKKVPHILVTGSSGGFVTVWDVKAKKESLTLNNLGRKAVSAVAWDPTQSTKLMTAIPDDTNPLILVWDLRNSNAPERTLKAHEQGVLSLSWCQQDPDLLLSCGKDNRTICWNPHTGQPYGDFPIVTNWTFQTRWNPHNPNILATASFDGKISVQTIQSTRPAAGQAASSQRQTLDDEDFFNNAQTEPQGDSFSLPKAPKWLERPIGASFGFGGKIVSFRPAEGTAGARRSNVQISQFAVDSSIGTATESFEKALQSGDLASICRSRIAAAASEEEKADWRVIETLISKNPRKKLVEFLGFVDDAEDTTEATAPESDSPKDASSTASVKLKVNGAQKSKHNRSFSFFDSNADSDGFLSNLSATKGAKTNNPFKVYTGSESAAEKKITRALLLGQFDNALEICLKEDRMSDAFMLAICGGEKCIEKAQKAYFLKQAQGPNYLRLLASVVGKNLWDIVYNADLSGWKEVMATLCTFADEKEFPDLCEALGDRLEEELKHDEGKTDLRKDASFCYLAGSKLEKVVAIWISETAESERAGVQADNVDSTFSLHARSLQSLIEKVTVFREVTNFQDTGRDESSDWKLAALYDKYTEYADVVAAHGQLQVAEKYLDLLPTHFAAAETARNRVKQASKKATPQAATRQQANTASRTPQRTQPLVSGYAQQQSAQVTSNAGPTNPYAPTGQAGPSNPYAPSGQAPYPSNFQQQPQGPVGGFNQGQGQGLGIAPPPRNINPSPSVAPPSRSTNMTNWNDTPMVTKPPTSRRGTPAGPSTITSPFPNQQSPGYPAGAPYSAQQRATPPLAPPPKGSAPPPRLASPPSAPPQSFQQPDRPPSVATNAYAPPPPAVQSSFNAPPSTIQRGPSPYNPPPTGAPSQNRYAPSPAPQVAGSDPRNRSLPPPPPQGGSIPGPPSNQYAPQSNQFAPSQGQAQPAQAPPSRYTPDPSAPQAQQGPPSRAGLAGPPPGIAPPSSGSVPQQPPQATPPPPAQARHAPGDRSHIPENARVIFEVFNSDMQRIKPRAPPSFKAQVIDTEKRLNILFDHLNNESLLKPDTVDSMAELAGALRARDYESAQAIQLEVHTNKMDQCGQWMVGVKRLISMSKATPFD
ncbi:MAG: hypothetical protein M1825_000709 [Sarcosagium campestre]|nr:MAG: hypothetical protein M1825_000709 [Sarcosagium campestre]